MIIIRRLRAPAQWYCNYYPGRERMILHSVQQKAYTQSGILFLIFTEGTGWYYSQCGIEWKFTQLLISVSHTLYNAMWYSSNCPRDRAPSRHPRPGPLASGSPIAGGAGTPRDRAPSRHPRPAPLASGTLVDSQPLSDILSNIISPSENFQLFSDNCTPPVCTPSEGVTPSVLVVMSASSSLNIQNSISQVLLLPVILIVISSSPKQKFETLSRGVYTICDIEINIVLSPVDIRKKSINH